MEQCNRLRKNCSACQYRYTREDKGLESCPNCGADRHCRNYVTNPGAACRMHGGTSRKGIESPFYKTGRYSKYLPDKLRERYEAGLMDDRLLELSDEIALIDSRVEELLESIADVNLPDILSETRTEFRRLDSAIRKVDAPAMEESLVRINELLNEGSRPIDQTWRQIADLVEGRRRLVESQRRRAVEIGLYFPVEEGLLLVARLQGMIIRYVPNPQDRVAIARELEEIARLPAGVEPSILAR